MDWDQLEQRKVRPPFRPRVVSSIKLLSFSSILKKLFQILEERT